MVNIKYYIEVYFYKLLFLFGYKLNENKIPKGCYCYERDFDKDKREPIDGYWIKPCKYYKYLGDLNCSCLYIGFIGWDCCLGDQCKICNKNK